jgi:hypothetical protein
MKLSESECNKVYQVVYATEKTFDAYIDKMDNC